MTIFEFISKNGRQRLPMHMPGHKRRTPAKYLKKLGAYIDITEISGADDLHDPRGIIKEAHKRASELWGSAASFILVGGSTVGILAGIYSVILPGDTVIMARNCHKSVYHAVEICGATPRYISPEKDGNTGIFLSVSPSEVESALENNKGAKLVVITSPTYEGVISDIKSIAEVCRRRGVLLMVDEAHGAHLDLSDKFTGGAVKAGADIVVQSLHKTLPSLTQTAIAHLGERTDKDKFSRALGIFETSSPSYLLMASADECVGFIKEHRRLFEKWSDALNDFYKKTSSLSKLTFFRGENCFSFDKSKIVISTAGTDKSGFELAEILREKYSIEIEMACEKYVVAMTGLLDGKKELSRLAKALCKIDRIVGASDEKSAHRRLVPEYATSPKEAVSYPSESVFSGEAEGCVSAEYIWAYPPGIPLIVPGEIFDGDTINYAKELSGCGSDVKVSDKTLKTLKIVKK